MYQVNSEILAVWKKHENIDAPFMKRIPLFYTKPNGIGGYLNYGQQKTFEESNSTLTAQEAKEKYSSACGFDNT